jgi:hypothetical protein
MKTKIILAFMVVLISLPSMLCLFVFSSASITICVAPSYVSVGLVEIFSVNIDIADVPSPGLFSYQVTLCYDTDCLEAVAAEMPDGHFLTPTTPGRLFVVHPGTIDNAAGTVWFAAILLSPEDSKTGSGTIMTVQFRAIATGNITFQLEDVILVGPSAVQASPHVYESKTDQSPVVTIVPEFSLPIILSTFATVALLTLLVWRRKQLWLK